MTCLSYEEFVTSCREFLQTSEVLGDTWKLGHSSHDSNGFYLSKTKCFKADSSTATPRPATEIGGEQHGVTEKGIIEDFALEPEPPDPSSVSATSPQDFITYEYHIVYSISHSVPTLYFNAWRASGKLLTLQEVWQRVHFQYNEQIANNKWNSLTQMEHPVLGRPFFQLHPCHTAELMGTLCCDNDRTPKDLKKYLICWLSMFGPVVGLKVPIRYFNG